MTSEQPRGRRGTVGHPYSALNLRLALATFGLVSCGVLAGLAGAAGILPLAVALGVLALIALVDIIVIQRRRRARRRAHPDQDFSLFE